MREIKFRAWHPISELMYYPSSPGDVFTWREEGQTISIMQYIDLNDKNGREIYEGDYLKRIKTNGQYYKKLYFIRDIRSITNTILCSSMFEVIGNIHENPELIANGEVK